MQFHRDGFRAGDPTINEAASGRGEQGRLPDEVDVLIVGSGPAGLVLAAQLSAFPEITTRVLERKNERLLIGQADGIACRTVEMFEAFGFSDRILAEAYWVNETVFWSPNPEAPSEIIRTGRIPDTEAGLSEFPHLIVNQARVHDYLLDTMEASASRLVPDYGVEVLAVRPGAGDAPVEVDVRVADGDDIVERTIRARYVVGCDGARSVVRSSIGLELRGDRTKQAWGVIDVLVDTDFPDIRFKAAVKSVDGTVLIIPREGGYLVRLYIELDRLGPAFQVPKNEITLDSLITAARHILSPYRFDVKEVAWWSVYEVGQRVLDRFDDRQGESSAPSVFLAGDACHTHSAKAGQGMNVSMQDAFNLGWKLAAVLRGQADRDLLLTYSDERQPIARELIEFDREYAQMFAESVVEDDTANQTFQSYFQAQGRFTAGVATHYRESRLTAPSTAQNLAEGYQVGMRFHSAPVLRVADSKKIELGHLARADGRWRLYLFADAGDPTVETSRFARACARLSEGRDSVIRRFTAADADIDSVIDVRGIFQHDHHIGVEHLPPLLVPHTGLLGLRDYEKAARAIEGELDIFALRGISRERGAMVLVRPDQYVTAVLDLDDSIGLSSILGSAMLAESRSVEERRVGV